ncbi:SDA1-domain-containing protein [Dentipellis sp. KUC8613]|nr:SDA1-domain-containing protein [Dentipellis sp. KUC8613]
MARGILLTANLPQLQNLIKRDPAGYREEFLQQWNHYISIRHIFQINPNEQANHFRELVSFIAQVTQCYPAETKEFPSHLSSLLLEHYGSLSPDIRHNLVQNLVMLKNKEVITSLELLKTLFPLLPRTTSSSLRTFIRKTILMDIRTANARSKNLKLNRAVQAMLFGMVERGMDAKASNDRRKDEKGSANGEEALWAIIVTKELWSKGVWDDAKSVAIVALGCFHPVIKVQSASLHFFLGGEEEEEDSDDDDEVDIKSLEHKREVKKKTRSGDKKLRKIVKAEGKKKKRKSKEALANANFPALELLHDPQGFAEKLYDSLVRFDKRFQLDHKILIMQLLSRVAASHKLTVLGFYTYIMKYLTYHQLRVPGILACLVQSVHSFTPPDALTPVVAKLAQEFIHPGVGGEVIAAGLNSIREICRRQPWAIEEDLLGDLIEYRKSRDKAVTSAARGLLQLFREVNPGMLKRRERGKNASMSLAEGQKPAAFGHGQEAAVDIEGLRMLEDHLAALREEDGVAEGEEVDEWDGWDVESNSSEESSDSGGWINVDSDGDDNIDVSDSDDEAEKKAEEEKAEEPSLPSTLATTKILTPADFALLNDLRVKAAEKAVESGAGPSAKRKLAELQSAQKASASADDRNTFISEQDILGPRKKAKADYEERMASIAKGREGREKFGSMKGKKNKETVSSTTNREKKRNKPLMMIMGSKAVRGKKKASLRDKQRKLRAHIEKAKKAYH